MGRHYQKAIPMRPAYDEKLISFSSSLGDAICKGKTIPYADNDVTYTLKLQNDRLKEKNIEMDFEVFEWTNKSPVGNTFFDGESWYDEYYKSTVGLAFLGVIRRIRQNDQIIYQDKHRRDFYGTVTDVISGSHPDNESICCPNCAAVSTVEDLQNGCPYCGTQYKMDDLFPKITGFYFFDSLRMTKKQVLIGWPVCTAVCALVSIICRPFLNTIPVVADILNSSYDPDYAVNILYGPVACIVWGGFFFLLLHLLFKLARVIVDLKRMGTAKNRERFEHRMKNITSGFSFEYFKNKAISLIKTAIYSKDEGELLCYKGEPLSAEFKDIIDLNYAGTFGIMGFVEENGIISVETKSYFDVLSVKDNSVSLSQPVISATFKRRTDIPVNLNFSMTKIDCPSCARSFNPVKNKFCPSCGREYELIADDWVLIDLKMEK